MSNYLIVENGKDALITSKKPCKNDYYSIWNEKLNTLYPLSICDVVDDGENYIISNKVMSKEDCKLLLNEIAKESQDNSRERQVYKVVDYKMSSPYTSKYMPFTRAVLIAIDKKGQQLLLSIKQHDQKLSLIRDLNELANGSAELSIKKASLLLELYGLCIEDILSPEFILTE